MLSPYKAIVRNSPGWRERGAATLGVSVASPNWQGDRFAAILELAASNFAIIRIDVTDALYRHNFMAEGVPPDQALNRATCLGSLWFAQHEDLIDACPVRPQIVRWAEWYQHRDYRNTLADFQNCYATNGVFREAVDDDVWGFYNRKGRLPTQTEIRCARDYLIEEVSIATLQARELASVKLYPGDDLRCLHAVRRGLVSNAPKGLEREQHARVKFDRRGRQVSASDHITFGTIHHVP